jgi:hypothetical protein
MAQFGSAPALGAGSRGFKSLCPDHYSNQVRIPKFSRRRYQEALKLKKSETAPSFSSGHPLHDRFFDLILFPCLLE